MEEITYCGYHILISRKSKNKNTYFRVKNDGTILVTCPYHIETKILMPYIDSFITKLATKYDESALNKLDYKNGGQFIFLGKDYKIRFNKTNEKEIAILNDCYLDVYLKSEENIVSVIDNFLRKEANVLLNQRFNIIIEQFKHIDFIPQLKIRKMTSRFGVCYYKKASITLSTLLMHYELDCIDYVIVHELAHFIQPNHSKKFYYLVEMYLPNYKSTEKKLKNLKVSY